MIWVWSQSLWLLYTCKYAIKSDYKFYKRVSKQMIWKYIWLINIKSNGTTFTKNRPYTMKDCYERFDRINQIFEVIEFWYNFQSNGCIYIRTKSFNIFGKKKEPRHSWWVYADNVEDIKFYFTSLYMIYEWNGDPVNDDILAILSDQKTNAFRMDQTRSTNPKIFNMFKSNGYEVKNEKAFLSILSEL